MSESKRKTALIVEVDMDELALRIAEAACEIERPPGMPAKDALAQMSRALARDGDPDIVPGFYRSAQAASRYIAECARRGKRPS